MGKKKNINDAVEILHRKFIKDRPNRLSSLETERVNAEVAKIIHDLRKDAGLNQKELADLIGTTQSAISRLEDADYEGHSLSILNRIAKAFNQRLTVLMRPTEPEENTIRYVFQEIIKKLRQSHGLTVGKLAKKLDLDPGEIIAMERNNGYRPSPFTLFKLSQFYEIPQTRLNALAGATQQMPHDLKEHASRFAAHSESFSTLTKEEKKYLDEFVKVLKTEA